MSRSLSMTWLVDAVIVVTLLECFVLLAWRLLTGRGIAPIEFMPNLASGLCLMLALRCVVLDGGTHWVALFLLGAGVAHGIDLGLRWRRREADDASARVGAAPPPA
ncbi:hypothetical protein [Variovorax sp. GT1P44]|uniref:hypothetical protein n=1 Tax=Variovorax sp. GT1P44 TaxID=3443742 RepID=UPI003F45BD6A